MLHTGITSHFVYRLLKHDKMSLWSSLQVLLSVSVYLTCADITTEPFVVVDDYYNYVTLSFNENKTNEVEEVNITPPSVFDLNNYNNSCNGNELNETLLFCETLGVGEKETCLEFEDVMESMMAFPCYLSEVEADVALNKSIDFLNNCQERQTCERSVDVVKTLMTGLMMCNATEGDFMDLHYNLTRIQDLQNRVGPLNNTYALGMIVKQLTMLVNGLDIYIYNLQNLINYLNEENLTNIFLTPIFKTRINIAQLQLALKEYNKSLLQHQDMQTLWKKIDVFRYDVRLVTFVLIFIVGVTANTILLIVFVKYPNMRTTANIMLMNLTLIDCVSLILNLPLNYLKATSMWSFGVGGCKAFYFIRYMTISVSSYSVAMISVQRFLAVTRFPTADGCIIGEKTKAIIMLTGVWFLGIVYSLPRVIFSEINKGMCSDVSDDIIGIIVTSDLVMICLVPTLLMAVFSCLTAATIKKSVSNPTGERTGQEQLRQNRLLSAHVLTGLAILFVVSYFPSFIFYFMTYQLEIKAEGLELYVIDTVTYLLQFTNSCLNPVALCIMSKKYRKYYQEILSCCKIPVSLQKALATSDISVATTESNI